MTVSSMSLELEIPAGMHVMQIATGDGFTFDVKKDGNQIVSITWKREIKPKECAVFTFTAHNPQPGALQWKAHQTFADGSMRHWIGERGTKEPASVTTIVPKGGATNGSRRGPGAQTSVDLERHVVVPMAARSTSVFRLVHQPVHPALRGERVLPESRKADSRRRTGG